MRLFVTVIGITTTGLGAILGVSVLLWSTKRINRLNGKLGKDYEDYIRNFENPNVQVLLEPTEQHQIK